MQHSGILDFAGNQGQSAQERPEGAQRPVAGHLPGYRLEPVFAATSPEQRAEAVAFWLARGVLPRNVAERRAFELVCLVRRVGAEPGASLAGVSTVGVQVGPDGRAWYAYRMFLAPEHRVPYLMWAVTDASLNLLREQSGPAGMMIVTENPKLMRPGMRRSFERRGYRYHGRNPRGQDVWLVPFGCAPCASADG